MLLLNKQARLGNFTQQGGEKTKMATTKQNSNKGARILILATIAVAVIAIVFVILNQQSKEEKLSFTRVDEQPPIASQPLMGNSEATVSIVEFGDYKCPTCRIWGERVWPELEKLYIDTGKANFAYVNVLFHGEESLIGAVASEAVYQSNPASFWAFHKALFKAQPSSQDHDNAWLTIAKAVEIAGQSVADLDKEAFTAHLNSDATRELIEEDIRLLELYGVKQTPTLFVNDIKIDNPMDIELIKAAIESELR